MKHVFIAGITPPSTSTIYCVVVNLWGN